MADQVTIEPVRSVRQAIGKARWNAFVEAHPGAGFWHRWEWLDYCLAYAGGEELTAAMLAPADRPGAPETVLALVPLINEGGRFTAGRNPTPAPIWSHENVLESIVRTVLQIANLNAVAEGWFCGPALSDPNLLSGLQPSDVQEFTPWPTRVVEVAEPEEARWAQVRKSYRQLIRRGLDRYDVTIHTKPDSAFDAYQAQHLTHYQQPRPLDTYLMQRQWLQDDLCVLTAAREHVSGEYCGLAYWHLHRGHAYYASAVYAQPEVAHPLIWRSLWLLAAHGVKTAELGWQSHPFREMTEKERQVAFFKRGFGGRDWTIPCHRWIMCSMQAYDGGRPT